VFLWTTGGLKGACYNRSNSECDRVEPTKNWFEKLFVPHVRRLGQRVTLIGENLASHFSEAVIRTAEEKTSKCCVTKDHLPGLLRKLCLSLCDETEEKLVSHNMVAGFRKCGIVPLSRNEVLSRLPSSSATDSSSSGQPPDSADTGAAAAVSSAVLNHLSKMRNSTHSPDSEQPQRRKRVKVHVEPGCSISFEDLNNNTLEPASSSTPKHGSHTDSGNLPTGTRAKNRYKLPGDILSGSIWQRETLTKGRLQLYNEC